MSRVGLAWICFAPTLAVLSGCRRSVPERQTPGSTASNSARRIPAATPSLGMASREKSLPVTEHEEPAETMASGTPAGNAWIVDDLFDVGPAGPAAATSYGVVMVTREGEAVLTRFRNSPVNKRGGAGHLGSSPKPGATRLEAIEPRAADFSPSGVAPAAIGDAVYFVFRGQLVRRRFLQPSALEALASDACDGSQVVAAAEPPGPLQNHSAVAYVGYLKRRRVARLWAEGAGVSELSPEGTAMSSVALTRAGETWLALSLEGRSSMSPLHARTVRREHDGLEVGNDVVVWVAGSAQQLTQLSAVGLRDGSAQVFLPIERDITHFGLARLKIDREPRMDVEVSWRNYPNGIEPAAATAAWICGEPVVFYARPADATPHGSQELHLSRLTDQGLGPSLTVARAARIVSVSVASLPMGALVAYVADRRTWAFTVRCP